jgi:hypothetical protein
MSRKTVVKVILDFIMELLLVLMYQKKVISLDFHEIGGLSLFGLFLIHKLLNWKWITKVTGRLFNKTLPLKTKLCYWLDVLLLISFVTIIVSGILISEILFSFAAAPGWKTVHYFSAALSLVIIGMHLGLHWGFLMNVWKKLVRLPRLVARPLAAVLLVAILGFGGYSLATTSFLLWLEMPFDSSLVLEEGGGHGSEGEETELSLTSAAEAETSSSGLSLETLALTTAEPAAQITLLAEEETASEPAAETAEEATASVDAGAAEGTETTTEEAAEEVHTGGGGGTGLRDGSGKGKNAETTVEASNILLVSRSISPSRPSSQRRPIGSSAADAEEKGQERDACLQV